MTNFNNKIPANKTPKWFGNAYIDGKYFYEIFNSNKIIVDMQYPKLRFQNATNICCVRYYVYYMLLKAAEMLPNNYKLKIWDAWRPFELQNELYAFYKNKIIKKYKLLNNLESTKTFVN